MNVIPKFRHDTDDDSMYKSMIAYMLMTLDNAGYAPHDQYSIWYYNVLNRSARIRLWVEHMTTGPTAIRKDILG